MIENREISALFQLMDDPDEEVFSTVSGRILSYGRGIIPNLESLWENTFDKAIQKRIEFIIHELQFKDLKKDILDWKKNPADLLQGALIINKFSNPEVEFQHVLHEIEQIRRNIWLELNSYLTPIEQIGTVTGVLYGYYKLHSHEIDYKHVNRFLISEVITSKNGNAISNGILYLILCRMLDIPVKALNLPRQFILGYFATEFDYKDAFKKSSEKLIFFIDPINGQVYSKKDVQDYLKRISLPPVPSYYRPIDNKRIIQILLEELSKCYKELSDAEKQKELKALSDLMGE